MQKTTLAESNTTDNANAEEKQKAGPPGKSLTTYEPFILLIFSVEKVVEESKESGQSLTLTDQ